jgi:hypothetical protein
MGGVAGAVGLSCAQVSAVIDKGSESEHASVRQEIDRDESKRGIRNMKLASRGG